MTDIAADKRFVVLDTETTGLGDGHRILEIGCVEIIGRKLTGKHYHVYIHPQRDIDIEASAVHGITLAFLEEQGAPVFEKIADDFRQFISGAELVIHNARFDVGKMDYEFNLLGLSLTETFCTVLDTLALAKDMFPGARHTLDALCNRFDIDNSQRDLHGALLDAELLAEVYLAMTGGQTDLVLDVVEESHEDVIELSNLNLEIDGSNLKVIKATAEEQAAHEEILKLLAKKSEQVLWR